MTTIASFGDNLKVFTYSSGKFEQSSCHTYKSHGMQLRGGRISWSGNYLVCAFEESGVIPVLTYRNSILSVIKRRAHPNASSAAFFNSTNRNLVLGNQNGTVSIWDVKEAKTTVEFPTQETNPVKFLSVNRDDAYIAAARSASLIRLYSCTTNHLVNTLKLDTEEEFTDLKFSHCTRNHLGCSTMEGSVVIWDTNTGVATTHLKNVSPSACSGIAFSPTNSKVVVSVSLSRSVKVHDVRQKKTVFELEMNQPLTCVDMLENEPVVIMGTMDGFILALDLRSTSPAGEVFAHAQRVTSLRSAPSTLPSKGKQFCDAQINTPDEPSPKTTDVSISDIFSPVNANVSSCLAIFTDSPDNPPTMLDKLPVSPMEATFQKWGTLQKSTPNTDSRNGLAPAYSYVDSFMAEIRSADNVNGTDSESPIFASDGLRSSESMLNGLVTPKQGVVDVSAMSDSSSKDSNNPLLLQVLEAVTSVSAEMKSVKEAVKSLSSELKVVQDEQAKARLLLLDILDSLKDLPYAVRWEHLITRELLENGDTTS